MANELSDDAIREALATSHRDAAHVLQCEVIAFRLGVEQERAAFNANMKILSDLLDRAYKINLLEIPSLRVTEQNTDSNDPLVAWMSDVRSVLYRNKPTPDVFRDLANIERGECCGRLGMGVGMPGRGLGRGEG